MYSIEELDSLKTKILKYVLYKKRTEKEIRQKFCDADEDMLEDAICYLKEAGYINDSDYIERSMREFMALKNLSLKEVNYKLYAKGISRKSIEDYMAEHGEELVDYEIQSAKNIMCKKDGKMEWEEIEAYLHKKGYLEETIHIAQKEYRGE